MNNEILIEFPCDFPIKAMGKSDAGFESHVLSIIRHHVEESCIKKSQARTSKAGNFTSVTVTILAHSRKQLDSIFWNSPRQSKS